MPYIPKEHEQYPVLPYRRKHGGEVFSYLSWPMEKIIELAGEDLTPLYYRSYKEYFDTIDSFIALHADEPDTVWLLDRCKRNIVLWNTKEEWSICRYIGEDDATLHHGGYYYWPAMAADPQYHGVIDDEESTNYGYPTDADLWEIIVDPTGMAQNRIYGGGEAPPKTDREALLAKINQITPEDLETFRMLGSEEP